tara:strand:+ start:1960 stop:2196 length:237 start_codon:yes stop_codon:yes gene_type:complete
VKITKDTLRQLIKETIGYVEPGLTKEDSQSLINEIDDLLVTFLDARNISPDRVLDETAVMNAIVQLVKAVNAAARVYR